MRVLLVVMGCDPNAVGESWWGYQMARGISERVDATIITMTDYGKSRNIAAALPRARVIECVDWPTGRIHERFNHMAKPGYIKFYRFVQSTIRSLMKEQEFDLIHQFTPLSMRFPSPCHCFDVPLILGPYGGSVPTPENFQSEMGTLPWYARLRGTDKLRLKWDPFLRRSLSSASLIFGVAPYVQELLKDIPVKRFEIMLETGIHELPEIPPKDFAQDRLKLLFVGRLVPNKGPIYAIRALGLVGDLSGVTLDVVGDGEDRAACEEEVRRLGLESRVLFHGRIPRSEVDRFYQSCNVFLFPSLREPSGMVLPESMSYGLPLIVCDSGGSGHTVRDSFGFRLPVTTPGALPASIAGAIRDLHGNLNKLRSMSENARLEVASKYLWRNKIERILEFYKEVVEDDKLKRRGLSSSRS